MRIQLICRKNRRDDLIKKLTEKGFEISGQGDFIFFQKESEKFLLGKDKQGDRYYPIIYEAICYLECHNHDVLARTINQSYYLRQTLEELESILNPIFFLRVSKSYIINLKAIESITKWGNKQFFLRMKNGSEIIVGRTFSKSFTERFFGKL